MAFLIPTGFIILYRKSEASDRSTKDIKARFQAALTLKLWEGLNFSSSLQYEIFNSKRRDLYKEEFLGSQKSRVNYYTEYNDATGVVGKSAIRQGSFWTNTLRKCKGILLGIR